MKSKGKKLKTIFICLVKQSSLYILIKNTFFVIAFKLIYHKIIINFKKHK